MKHFPNARRHRKVIQLSLDPQAYVILKAMQGRASRWVSELILDEYHDGALSAPCEPPSVAPEPDALPTTE